MYDVKGRIAEMIDPAGKSTLYEYDGASGGCIPGNEASVACKANNLTKVTYPDGKSQTYWYNEASRIVTIQPLRSWPDRIASKCTAQHFQHAVPLFA
ncbi:hypothetical protein F2P44_34125 [Massilia sp. CCM 8695]|uniref:RHS repeat protein n=2 Tax=Massilia frigida TaxID=2609281 RepID=A0ABX0NKT7_9BURK|nr:hypothetical protein [Massilia frigida]